MKSANGNKTQQPELFPGATEVVAKPKKSRAAKSDEAEHLPPNLGQPVPVKVPDFSDPKRPKTCLEVDFPIVPINALSTLEGNAGKPIYQMSKWWARRRSCVFRAMLIAAATEAPTRKGADGKPLLDENGVLVPDETEAAKAVWDVYYANHQQAGNFKHLKVLDCFMGGGTTLVEGSRLGFQLAGVDLNPVAWFIVKNELACTAPDEVKQLFDRIEAEVKPQIQPFYVTDCPRGHKGKWLDVETGKPVDVDPTQLPPEDRKKYRYAGPEVIYTFWAKHGPCIRPECNHRTPIFRSPVVATKKLGVKYLECTCKNKACGITFHAELGDARIAPGAEHVILGNEHPYSVVSGPFARALLEYERDGRETLNARIQFLSERLDSEPGLKCPACGQFAGQYIRDILAKHRNAKTYGEIKKKDFRILPSGQGKKPVYCTLLIDPEWLKGSPGVTSAARTQSSEPEAGGWIDAPIEPTAAWYRERLKGLRLIEVRGQTEAGVDPGTACPNPVGGFPGSVSTVPGTDRAGSAASRAGSSSDGPERVSSADEAEDNAEEGEEPAGLPATIRLRDGRIVETGRGTVPKRSAFTCGKCGQLADLLESCKAYTSRARMETKDALAQRSLPVMVYALQCYDPARAAEGHPYGGRYFKSPDAADIERLIAAEREWAARREVDLKDFWPRSALPYTWMTHHLNGGIPNWGFTHWYKFFNSRQLLTHAQLLRAIIVAKAKPALEDFVLGAVQQYLRNQNMMCFWNPQRDTPEPFFSQAHYHPKQLVVENSVFGSLGRGNWLSSVGTLLEAAEWASNPWEKTEAVSEGATKSDHVPTGDPIVAGSANVVRGSSTEIPADWTGTFDNVITDPPFGDNVFYGDLSNFFYVWLRLALKSRYPEQFAPEFVPRSQEAVADRSRFPGTSGTDDDESAMSAANAAYQGLMTACWAECRRVMKDGGVMAFTFHHSADEPWMSILQSLFDSGWLLEATYPIRSDETKGEGGQFGSRKIEYDIIHVCRKRLEDPKPVSWPKMRQWVKAELRRLRGLLEVYKANELSAADIRVILRGKALEFYSRHYGKVFTAEDAPLSITHALAGINQLLDEDTGEPGERPPSILQPVAYQFLRLFGTRVSLSRDDVGKNLRGWGFVQREFEDRGWVVEQNKIVRRVPIQERFEVARSRPRKEMKTEIDQAHFLIGAALPDSGVNIEDELSRNTWAVRRSVEAVLLWYANTAVEPEIRQAADLAAQLLRDSLEKRRTQLVQEQGYLFDDLDDVA